MNCFIRNLDNPFFPLHCFHCAMIIPFRKTRPLRPRCNHLLLLLLLQNLPPPTRLSLKKCAPYLRIPTPADLSTTSMLTRRRVSHDVVSVFLARHWDSCFRIERGPEKNNLVSYLFLFERVLLHFSKKIVLHHSSSHHVLFLSFSRIRWDLCNAEIARLYFVSLCFFSLAFSYPDVWCFCPNSFFIVRYYSHLYVSSLPQTGDAWRFVTIE